MYFATSAKIVKAVMPVGVVMVVVVAVFLRYIRDSASSLRFVLQAL